MVNFWQEIGSIQAGNDPKLPGNDFVRPEITIFIVKIDQNGVKIGEKRILGLKIDVFGLF